MSILSGDMFAFLARFLLGLWGVSRAVVWLQNVWIPWLRKYALPHSTSSSWRFCFASKVENWSQFSSPWSSVCFSWYSWGPESGLSGWMNLQESVLLFPTCFQGVLDGKGMKRDPPSNFSYEMGRTWATVQIASQDLFVQTGGVVPPILYLESFCSWFLSNHHFHFVVVYVELVEASNIKSTKYHLTR